MNAPQLGEDIVFIVASPRSGTTLLADVLGKHPQINEWYEPYFVWEWDSGHGEDDVRDTAFATPAAVQRIRNEFDCFRRHAAEQGGRVIVEKLPEHAFHIPMINAVFPNARYIHLVRDGRDVVHSIHREWGKRRDIADNKKLNRFIQLSARMLKRQPLLRHRILALRYEARQRARAGLSKKTLMNKAKWGDGGGWGPRFPGWRRLYSELPLLAFNAHQWLACEQHIQRDLRLIEPQRVLDLRYEDFVTDPDRELQRLMTFMDMPPASGLSAGIDAGRTDQWRDAFDPASRRIIGNIIHQRLMALGYASDDRWFLASTPA